MTFFLANWKLNGNLTFCEEYIKFLKENSQNIPENFVIAPAFPYLLYLQNLIRKYDLQNLVQIASQDISIYQNGPHTGEVAAYMIQELQAKYTLIGHSERRQQYNENNQMIATKILRANQSNICPILCVGETLEQHNLGQVQNVIEKQIKEVLDNNVTEKNKIIVAYEPVWSIGTGKIPNQQNIQQVVDTISNIIDSHIANINYLILYGGSVNEKNITNILQVTNLSGVLVGSASNNIQQMKKILPLLKNKV